jgi:hypothetical protein
MMPVQVARVGVQLRVDRQPDVLTVERLEQALGRVACHQPRDPHPQVLADRDGAVIQQAVVEGAEGQTVRHLVGAAVGVPLDLIRGSGASLVMPVAVLAAEQTALSLTLDPQRLPWHSDSDLEAHRLRRHRRDRDRDGGALKACIRRCRCSTSRHYLRLVTGAWRLVSPRAIQCYGPPSGRRGQGRLGVSSTSDQ